MVQKVQTLSWSPLQTIPFWEFLWYYTMKKFTNKNSWSELSYLVVEGRAGRLGRAAAPPWRSPIGQTQIHGGQWGLGTLFSPCACGAGQPAFPPMFLWFLFLLFLLFLPPIFLVPAPLLLLIHDAVLGEEAYASGAHTVGVCTNIIF